MRRRQFLLGTAALAAAGGARPQPANGPVALVLGGGGCRGYGHIGVLRVLEKHGLKPDLIVGSSVGALVGALYAAGKSVAEIRELAIKGSWKTAVAKIQTGLKVHEPPKTEEDAQKWLREQTMRFAEDEDYIAAGLLLWRRGMFEPGPEHVQRVFHTLA